MARVIVTSIHSANYSTLWSLGASTRLIFNDTDFSEGKILVKEWMPQMDVLGHHSVRVAILHCGLGGVQEALYNGVPIICMPQMFDQRENGVRVTHYGFGMTLDLNTLTVKQLMGAILQVDDAPHRKAALQTAHMFLAAGGVHKASELIEHYQEIGYKHLQLFP